MNERITFILTFNDLNNQRIKFYINKINEKLCKIPFGKSDINRIEADTLPYHITLFAWNIEEKIKVIESLSQIEFPKLKIKIDDVKIMNGKENSYVLYFNVENNNELKLLQKQIYQIFPSKKYNPEDYKFHITIHIDKDYNKIIAIKEKILKDFKPFELEVNKFELYEIYPANLVKTIFSKVF